jgi:hypothetical protein
MLAVGHLHKTSRGYECFHCVVITLTSIASQNSIVPSQVGSTGVTNILKSPTVEDTSPAGDLASAETTLIATKSEAFPLARSMFNEVNVDPTQFFERPLTLAPIVWDTAFTITGYDWWSEYFSITAVQRKLYGYSRARFVFNLRFEYHPTAFHFGDLLIAAAFNHSGISGNNVSCAGGLFHFPHLMLSAANPTVAELQYPFHRIQPYMDLTVAAELTQTGRPIFTHVLWPRWVFPMGRQCRPSRLPLEVG